MTRRAALLGAVLWVSAGCGVFSSPRGGDALPLPGSRGGSWPGGIGAVLRHQQSAHRLFIDSLPADGAAARAGLRAGDEVVEIDGVAVREMDRPSVITRLRGEVGTRVRLSVFTDGGTREIEVERAPYAEVSRRSR
ncbi:MAG: PDZ domain-containing protein [Polyangiales bacterium]